MNHNTVEYDSIIYKVLQFETSDLYSYNYVDGKFQGTDGNPIPRLIFNLCFRIALHRNWNNVISFWLLSDKLKN